MQKTTHHIIISDSVKSELMRRKVVISRKKGKQISFDSVIRSLLGWAV